MLFREVEVPDQLVTAAREGDLVIFVGAGASFDAPSSLPSFEKLVVDVGTQAGSIPNAKELERPDVFLGDLADLDVDVHGLVARAIDAPGSVPNRLHHAIMSVAAAHPHLRVVTTNYDLHLESAYRGDYPTPEVFRGPALPIGDDFTGLVHLHGALDRDPRHLVVTEADFGRAYLREAWAARFLERMFSAFTVLFIGYSHGDVVMQYLARSLGREGRRYVLTDDAESTLWNRLGLTAIHYPVVAGSHAALTDALERWAELTSWGRLDHRRRVAVLVEQGPPDIPDEVSYLEQVFADPERIRFFTEHATGSAWLGWAATRPEFDLLFARSDTDDDPATHTLTRAITDWFVDNFACVEAHSPAALRLMRDRQWTTQTWDTVVHRLFAQEEPLGDWQIPWLVVALQRAPLGRHDLLDMMLADKSWQGRPGLGLMLLEHRTDPIVKSGIDFGDPDGAPRFEITLCGDEYWLTKAWAEVFHPMLDDHAPGLFDLAVRQLRRTYRLAHAIHPGFDPVGFGRSAIEPHDQDQYRDPHDVLIDAARDSLEQLLRTAPDHAARQIDMLTSTPEGILRRLGVHGWRLRDDRSADAKVAWVCDQQLLYDLELQHEVFLLLRDSLTAVTSETIDHLLVAVSQGPSPVDGHTESPYTRYNLLAWMHQVAPADNAITAAFNAAQEAHPDYLPREHPDLNMYMTSGFVEDAEPFSVDELHAAIEDDADEALTRLRAFATSDSFRMTGPTWTGALSALRACVARHPRDGLLLAPFLRAEEDDMRNSLIRGWGAAQLTEETDLPDLPEQVISVIGSWNLTSVRAPAAAIFANGGQADHPTRWHEHAAARTLATRLWPETEVTGAIVGGKDTFLEAINHPAGDLAQFWTKVTAAEWTRQADMWSGLPHIISTELDRMIDQPDRNGLLARCILITNLRFYHGAAPDWAVSRLLPLLDWNAGDPAEVPAMWRTFLSHGQYDAALLRAGLLDAFLTTLEHSQDLDDDRTMKSLGRQLATIALRSDDPPSSWLGRLTTKAPPMVRLAWTRSVGRELRDMEGSEAAAQWDRWIRRYWSDRVSSVPRPLTSPEASAIATWVLGLPLARAEAISLVEQVPAGLERDDRILTALAKQDLRPEAQLWARYLSHLLAGTPADEPWAICHYLSQIVPQLREGASEEAVTPVVEQALRLSCVGAPDW